MRSEQAEANLGQVKVFTTNGRGATIAEIADRAIDKIIYVGKDANPLLRDQAIAYRAQIRDVLEFYLTEAVRADRTTLANRFRNDGHPELVPLILED